MQVQNAKLHGRRVPGSSKVRELLVSQCLRLTMNKWFSHGQEMSEFEPFAKPPEDCCSRCMETCINLTDCEVCLAKLKNNAPRTEIVPIKGMLNSLRDFLIALNVNDHVSASTPPYSEETLAEVILENFDKFNDISDVVGFMEIFNFESEINWRVSEFIVKSFKDSLTETSSCKEDISLSGEDSENSGDENNSDSSEYFDSESEYEHASK